MDGWMDAKVIGYDPKQCCSSRIHIFASTTCRSRQGGKRHSPRTESLYRTGLYLYSSSSSSSSLFLSGCYVPVPRWSRLGVMDGWMDDGAVRIQARSVFVLEPKGFSGSATILLASCLEHRAGSGTLVFRLSSEKS